MKILLLGKGGQVGWELQRSLALLGEVVACDFDSAGELKADFSDPESLAPLVQRVRPDAIALTSAVVPSATTVPCRTRMMRSA